MVGWFVLKLYLEVKDELNVGGYDKVIKYFEKLELCYLFGIYVQQVQMDIVYVYYCQNEQV